MSSPSPSHSDYESADSTQERPNRWHGSAKTWQNLTASDRAVASSLTTARDRDLSIHLYNAHALKRKARELEEAKESGREVSVSVLEDTKGFVPPRAWVAWPLRPSDVPRDVGGVGGDETEAGDGLEAWTVKRGIDGEERSGEVLADVLAARTMRFVKERFEKRMRLDQDEDTSDEESGTENGSLESRDPSPEVRHEEEAAGSAGESRSLARKKNKRSARRHETPEMVPVVSADDERSRNLLRPTINHTLSRLDDVLMALHHARSACFQVARDNSDTDEEEGSGLEDMLTLVKRRRGRARKNPSEINSIAADVLTVTTSINKGRRRKVDYPRLEGETDAEYIIRVARLRKVAFPSSVLPREDASPSVEPGTPKKPKSTRTQTKNEEALQDRRNKKLELRDWSEVLGTAALVGFDSDVIQRATQRCAALFGETMNFHSILEVPPDQTQPILNAYQPDPVSTDIHDSPLDFTETLEKHVQDDNKSRSSTIDTTVGLDMRYACSLHDCPRASQPFRDGFSLRRHMLKAHKTKISLSDYRKRATPEERSRISQDSIKSSVICPYVDCTSSGKPFKNRYSLKRHLERKHAVFEVDEDEESDADVILEEEMEGGVHVDGFLKPFDYALKSFKSDVKGKRPQRMATRTSFVARDDEDVGSARDDEAVGNGDSE